MISLNDTLEDTEYARHLRLTLIQNEDVSRELSENVDRLTVTKRERLIKDKGILEIKEALRKATNKELTAN